MDAQPPQPGPSGSKSSRLAGASSNTSLIGKQQERRYKFVHHDSANAPTQNMTQDAHLKIFHETGSSTNTKQHAVGCEYIHTVVNGRQLTVYYTAGVRQERCDQFIATRNVKPPWSSKAFVRTVPEIEHHEVVSSGIFLDKFPDYHPCEWTKHTLITLEKAMKAYMVEVLAASHCLKQQLISCRY